jgi:hypothetical protein
MGYRSAVAVELMGSKQDVSLVLKTYAMSETAEQIHETNHILETKPHAPRLTKIDFNDEVHLIWEFEDTKWYRESDDAFGRLIDIVETYTDEPHNLSIALYFTRTGEEPADIEENSWGNTSDWSKAMFPYSGINCFLQPDQESKAVRLELNQLMEELCTHSS